MRDVRFLGQRADAGHGMPGKSLRTFRGIRQFLLLLLLVFIVSGCGSLSEYQDIVEDLERIAEDFEQESVVRDSSRGNAAEDSKQESAAGDSGRGSTEAAFQEGKGTLEVHFLDVGQGDATLIRQGEHAMLIDGGDNSKGTTVQAYLQSQGIEHLDYVIGTHPDADHVGGLDVVLYKFSWNQVILPEAEKDTKTYQDVLKVIQDKNQPITRPAVGDTYLLGMAEFTVIAPVEEDYGDSWNDYSVGIRLSFGENCFVFTGDAEEAAEEDMLESGMDLSADVLKIAHHGSDTANTPEFLGEVQPEFAVISCGEGNRYGHPRAEVMNNLRGMGIKVFRTDEQGTVVAVSDGNTITWNCSPSESWKAGEPG